MEFIISLIYSQIYSGQHYCFCKIHCSAHNFFIADDCTFDDCMVDEDCITEDSYNARIFDSCFGELVLLAAVGGLFSRSRGTMAPLKF